MGENQAASNTSIAERLQKMDDARPMTVYCALCPEWKAVGTAGETREAAQEHRAEFHPELKKNTPSSRTKKRVWSSAMTAEREAEIDEERRQRMRALGLS